MSDEVKDIQTEQATANPTSSYRSIFKATSLFGGVQVYQILISMVKSKFIAILLGPLGVGIQGMYTSALQFVQGLTSMGLSSSAVRNVSEASGSDDMKRVAAIVKTLQRLVWSTGLFGLFAVLILSSVLSETSFGDDKHIVAFVFLSTTLLFDQLSAGQKVVLQGLRRLKDLAKASTIGSTISLIISVPLFYIYGIKGIVPTLILNSITLLLLSWYYANKIQLPLIVQTAKETMRNGVGMLKMGIAMSWSGILVLGSAYALRWFIRIESGTEMVGLYTAGFTIINSYVGMIFTAIGTDYYPRLAAVNKDNKRMRDLVNQQGEIAVLILAPLLLICIVFMPLLIKVLYTDEFMNSSDFVIVAALGMMFKLGSWLISYQFVAKGESKLFVINETISNIYFLLLNIIGYKLMGLVGLGVAFGMSYFIYYAQVFFIAKQRYEFSFSSDYMKVFISQMVLLIVCFVLVEIRVKILAYLGGLVLIVMSILLSLKGLNNRMNLTEVLKQRLSK